MQERTPELPCKAIAIPAESETAWNEAIADIGTYNRLCEMLRNDSMRVRRTIPHTQEHDTARQMYQDHARRAEETHRSIEEAGETRQYEGITAYLIARAKVRQIAGNKVCTIYQDITAHKGETPTHLTDLKSLNALFGKYTAPALESISQEDIEALRANGMEDEATRMYRNTYEREQEYYNNRKPIAEPVLADSIKKYLDLYDRYLQGKIDFYHNKDNGDLRSITRNDTPKVIALLEEVITRYYKPPTKESNGKGSAEIGATIGLLLELGYIDNTPDKLRNLKERFVKTFPHCADINWKGVGKYYQDNSTAHNKQDTMRNFVKSFLADVREND